MKLLSTIFRKIEAGGEEAVREQLDTALGMWYADHGGAHKIVTVSEDSVCFADDSDDLYVARYSIKEGVVAISKVRHLCNVAEQATDLSHLDEVAALVVKAVQEDREVEADKLIKEAMEMRQDAGRAQGASRVEQPMRNRRFFSAKAQKGRFAMSQQAKKDAKQAIFLHNGAKSEDAKSEAVKEAIRALPAAAGNLFAALQYNATKPVIEGDVAGWHEGVPAKIKVKDKTVLAVGLQAKLGQGWIQEDLGESKALIEEAEKAGKKILVHVHDSPSDKEVKAKVELSPRKTGRGHSVRYQGKAYRLHGDGKSKGKIFLQDRLYHGIANRKNAVEKREITEADQSWKCSECGGVLMGSDKPCPKHPSAKVVMVKEDEGVKFEAKEIAGGKYKVQKTSADGVMDLAGEYDTAEGAASAAAKLAAVETPKGEGVILVNLKALTEGLNKNDFFYQLGIAWGQFRTEGLNQEAIEVLERNGEPQEVLDAIPFLACCTEAEISAILAGHLDAFDPKSIRAYAGKIAELAKGTEAIKCVSEMIEAMGSQAITEKFVGGQVSTLLDSLFLESDQFDFGAADDLGDDNMDDDSDDQGMQHKAEGPDGDGMDDFDMGDDMGGEDQTPPIQFEIPAADAKENFKKILDVIGNEIEDDEDFQDLKAKIDDDQGQLDGTDVVAMLQVITDYFHAIGKDHIDSEEKNAENQSDSETLDDMDKKTDLSPEEGEPQDGTDDLSDLDDIGNGGGAAGANR